jgi:uncharacterized phage protein (TIGR01671 family)
MREIKFRAWDKKAKIMLYNPAVKYYDGSYEIHDFPLMQYTGLKDKNGKEIYEGDIIKIQGKIDPSHYEKEFLTEQVEWVDGMGCWNITTHMLYNALGQTLENKYAMRSELTVIGNIYENPELLK